jgi:hypothetical protein
MAEGITRITVKGFKSIADECSLEIRPLTNLSRCQQLGQVEHYAAHTDDEANIGSSV